LKLLERLTQTANREQKMTTTPALPNDIIMKIIQMVDGGINRHKTQLLPSLKIIEEAGSSASRYTQHHVEEEEYDWGDLRTLNVLTEDNYNFSEWGYAFDAEMEDDRVGG